MRPTWRSLATAIGWSVCWAAAAAAQPMGTAITHQGRLTDGGNPANGPYDFRCILYDAPAGGSQVGLTVALEDVPVGDGLFTIALDFGPSAFGGGARWLEVAVRAGASTGAYTVIGARQELKPSPAAIFSASAAAVPWTGVSGKPAGFADNVDNDSGGTVTGIATGAGLTGGPITGSGTIAVAASGITTGLLADGAVTSPKIANGAVGLPQINQAQVQARVGGACPVGSYLRGINPDGTVLCTALPNANAITVAEDEGPSVGLHTSIAIAPDGRPVISHFDASGGGLRILRCGNASCTAGNVGRTLDTAGTNVVGLYTSIAIGADGLPVVSYHDDTANTLKVAKCANPTCSSASIATVDDPANDVGAYSSIAIGADGFPVIAYRDATAGALKVAKCTNAACTTPATITTADNPPNDVGFGARIAVGADGFPVISHVDGTGQALRVAKCSNAACNVSVAVAIVDPASVGTIGTGITVPADGLPVISYHDVAPLTVTRLKVAKCGNPSCSAGNVITTVDADPEAGQHSSIAIGADGLPVVSHYRAIPSPSLQVAKCGNAACSASNTLSFLDGSSGLYVGAYTSIAVGPDGLPVVSYFDSTFNALRVAKCGNPACSQ